ncbi:MAG: transcriptional regulator [bacterium]
MKHILLNPIIHQPVRTQLVALLASREAMTFNYLKDILRLSDGNLTTHMKKLIEAGYVDIKKEFVKNRPQTTYMLTEKGRKAFKEYLEQLKNVVKFSI